MPRNEKGLVFMALIPLENHFSNWCNERNRSVLKKISEIMSEKSPIPIDQDEMMSRGLSLSLHRSYKATSVLLF